MNDLLKEIMDLPTEIETEEAGELKSYLVCYRDTDGTIKKAWHLTTDKYVDYVKSKYKKQGKDIMYFVERDKAE